MQKPECEGQHFLGTMLLTVAKLMMILKCVIGLHHFIFFKDIFSLLWKEAKHCTHSLVPPPELYKHLSSTIPPILLKSHTSSTEYSTLL